ncbi:MAG: TIGR00266 family protein [Methanoregulaceae archaeon]
MKHEIRYKPSYSLLVASLDIGESITAEAGSLTYMQPTIDVKTRQREKGFLGSLGISLIGGQSFFVNEFSAVRGPGKAAFSAAPLGDIETLDVRADRGFIIRKSSYVASQQGVSLDIQWQGFTKGIFGQGLFMIRVTGTGLLFINTFGALDHHTLAPGEVLIVDNHHLVAFSDTCQYKVTKFGGLKETILGGEGLVTEITGPGEIYLQTKNVQELAEMIWSVIEPRVSSKTR